MLATTSEINDSEEHALWVLFWLAGMGMLVADLVAFYWVGLWQAMVARNPHRAASVSLARILIVPWIVIAIVSLIASLVGRESRSDPGRAFFWAYGFSPAWSPT